MGNRATCPGCDSHTSSVWAALRDGEPCPYCGLSADAIVAVTAAREGHGSAALKAEVSRLLIENDRLREALAKTTLALSSARAAVESATAALAGLECHVPDGTAPWEGDRG